jgi:hypothetical protein
MWTCVTGVPDSLLASSSACNRSVANHPPAVGNRAE